MTKAPVSYAEQRGLIPSVNNAEFSRYVREYYRQKKESDARLQRRRMMTQYERGRGALEQMTKNIIDWHMARGLSISWDMAHKYAEGIAHKAEYKGKS